VLVSKPYDLAISARMLDFFAAETQWQRKLWDIGACLSLRELVEATTAVADGALTSETVAWLKGSVMSLVGPDVGLGSRQERSALTGALKSDLVANGFHARLIRQIAETAESQYLSRWVAELRLADQIGTERVARALAGHVLGLGFSPAYLHRWWTYQVRHASDVMTIADVIDALRKRAQQPSVAHDVIVPLARATERVREVPGWLDAETAGGILTKLNKKPVAGLAGAIRADVVARDPGAAVESMADRIDRFVARITLGGRGENLTPLPYVWAAGPARPHERMRLRRRRGLEIPVLVRREEPITGSVAPRIDASLELLGPVDQGSAAPAAAGGWAAVETLLTAPGDRGKVQAADRLASLVACSFPRAELTELAHHFLADPTDAELARDIEGQTTNTGRAGALAKHLAVSELRFADGADQAAADRMRRILSAPHSGLRDVEEHVQRVIRRLYRVRNLVLHNAATDSLTLAAALQTAAPLLGAGIDRIVRGAVLQGIEPLDLAARARLVLEDADNKGPGDFADLLQLAEDVGEPPTTEELQDDALK
jgi:hypothetical protein